MSGYKVEKLAHFIRVDCYGKKISKSKTAYMPNLNLLCATIWEMKGEALPQG